MRRRRSRSTFDWPDAIRVDGGLVGGGQLAWPDGPEDEPPDWLVFGGMIRTVSMAEGEPGLRPLSHGARGRRLRRGRRRPSWSESFARHLMVQIDAWQEYGFERDRQDYLARLAPETGVRRDIDDNGDLLVRRIGQGRGRAADAACRRSPTPSWLDPATRGPRL